MIETGKAISAQIEANAGVNENERKVVVITGALKPERFKDSDAAYNIGGAVVATSAMNAGVYVCMSGRVFPCERCTRNMETGQFIPC